MRLRCPPSRESLVIEDPEVAVVLDAFRVPRTVAQATEKLDSFDADEVAEVVQALQEHGALVVADEPPHPIGLGAWEPHSLYFHQMLSVARPPRRALPGEAPPPVKPPMSSRTVVLDRSVEIPPRTLADILQLRVSRREHSDEPIVPSALSALLWASCRNVELGGTWHRPYPSGGGAYSLELYLAMDDRAVEGVGAGVWHYCPSRHLLEEISCDVDRAMPFMEAAAAAAGMDREPAVTMLITSRIARVSATYERVPLGLVLQEVGCLFQTLYLVATALDLAPCAIGGTLGGEALATLGGFHALEEPIVGRFVLGNRC